MCTCVCARSFIVNIIKRNEVPERGAGVKEKVKFGEVFQSAGLPGAIRGFASAFGQLQERE